MIVRDPVLDRAAYHEHLEKGYTCRDCTRHRRLSTGEEYCELDRDNFPRICKDDKFELADERA